jgi:hypothetical protein
MKCFLQECGEFHDHFSPGEQIAYCARFGCQAQDRNDPTHEPREARLGHTCCELSQFRSIHNQNCSDADDAALDRMLKYSKNSRLWCWDDFETNMAAFREMNLETTHDRDTCWVCEDLLRTHFGIGV